MAQVKTLQEALEAKARRRAKQEAEEAVAALPYFDRITTYAHGADGMTGVGQVTVTSYNVNSGLREAIEDALYNSYLKQETDILLAACERMRDLISPRDEEE